MTTPVEKRNNNKFCEFHGEVGYNTDECMHLRRQIVELIKAGKLSHVIKELKQGSGKDQPKAAKKGETSGKDKPLAILMLPHPLLVSAEKSYGQWDKYSASKNRGCRAFNLYMDEFCGVPGRILILRSSKIIPLECTMVSGLEAQPSPITQDRRMALCKLLRYNLDIFAWKPEGMTGVSRHLAEHRLNVREGCLPVRQKKTSQEPKRNKAIQEEVAKLIDAGIMKEVYYYSWLSNPVMVMKHDVSWRMCVDFKDLNKACLKDGYPLLEIDWKVESLCGYPFKCFLDAYKGYRQIKLDSTRDKHEDESQKVHLQGGGRHVLGIQDVQKLNGKLASLNRFLSKSAEKSLPFFKALKKCMKKSDFQWTAKAEAAFKQMKRLITELPTLTAPMEKE
ncbi:hypothetical protein Tco_0575582 [Tanacetum coccineum]